ncbi:MAG: POTRA domain-containing protein [Flavobacteriaceae bacterium]
MLFLIGFFIQSSAQDKKNKSDSTAVYQDIYDYSQKRKSTKFLHKFLFRPINAKTPSKSVKNTTIIAHGSYEGKIIRRIIITTLDPFGYSVDDTLKTPTEKLSKFGNSIHLKTKKGTIKDLLLFKENQAYDSLKITESERLIRSQRYTRRVRVVPVPNTANDSVDITIRVLDSWSLIPNGSLSSSSGSVKLTERNLFGFGHQVSGAYKERFSDHAKEVTGNYTIANIKNSYIKLELGYDRDYDNNSSRSISVTRNFYSPLTKWAGGFDFKNESKNEEFYYVIPDSVPSPNLRFDYYDAWLGRAFQLSKATNNISRNTRAIAAITFNNYYYKSVPEPLFNPENFFSNACNVIGHIGLTTQKYYQDKFLFNYDIIEDVPYGNILALTFGYQDKNATDRVYIGSKIAYGNRFSFGYLSGAAQWGSFLNGNLPRQTALKIDFVYFTDLISLGRWKIRQFIKPSYVWGKDRYPTEKDKLNLDNQWGIEGFDSPVNGTQKWVLNLQTQTYAPNMWKGFRFSPYANIALGSVAEQDRLFKSKVYSKFSIGALINNDFLVFNSFQISLSYFPKIPTEGVNIFKTNSFENGDLSIPNFQLDKPAYIEYR